jgi:hypothetical protein
MAENYVLVPEPDGTGHTATLWLWVRLNGPDARRVRIAVTAPEAEVRPAQALTVALSSAAPLARVRFLLHYPPATPRRGYDVRAAVVCADVPVLRVERRTTVTRPLDWRALGPLTRAQDEAAGMALKDARQLDFTKPLPAKTSLPAWTTVLAPSHYDCFGSLDFCLLWGQQERTAAFIVTRIHAARDGTYRLLTGADDDLRLRLDGKPMMDLPPRYLRPLVDSLRYHDLPLTAGDHLLVGRVRQDIKFWQARVQFYGADNLPTPDVWGLGAGE